MLSYPSHRDVVDEDVTGFTIALTDDEVNTLVVGAGGVVVGVFYHLPLVGKVELSVFVNVPIGCDTYSDIGAVALGRCLLYPCSNLVFTVSVLTDCFDDVLIDTTIIAPRVGTNADCIFTALCIV